MTKGHLWLIGMMGAGKTEIGKRLARLAGLPFRDTDREIEEAAGRNLAELFGTDGEAAFRERETEVINRLAAGDTAVVATGGGAISNRLNVEAMRSTGTVIWLVASPFNLLQRIGDDPDRPLLACGDRLGMIRRLLEQREEAYAEAAHAIVDTEGRTVQECTAQVVAVWKSFE